MITRAAPGPIDIYLVLRPDTLSKHHDHACGLLQGATVSIRAEGADLREFESDTTGAETAKTATTYVEAVLGAKFTVEIRLTSAFPYTKDHLACHVYLDGKWVGGVIGDLSLRGTVVSLDGSIETSGSTSTLRRFAFAEHQMNDDAVKASHKDKFASLGEVMVKLTRCRKAGADKTDHKTSFSSAAEKGIPEKALKGRAIGAHAKLAAAEAVPHRDWVVVDFPYGKEPSAAFIFKYRTRRDLQIEGIIERSPSPVPLEERDPNTLNQEEMREVIRRMREREQNAPRVKQEIKREKRARSATLVSDDDGSDSDGLTITADGDRRKRSRQSVDSGIEVVDLS